MNCNGWTNYATWRVALEIFDGFEADSPVDADYCEEYADEIIFKGKDGGLKADYAQAFLSDVNWHEIAEHINENIEEED